MVFIFVTQYLWYIKILHLHQFTLSFKNYKVQKVLPIQHYNTINGKNQLEYNCTKRYLLRFTSSFGMNNSFWNAFMVKVSHFIHEDKVLHEHWTSRSDGQHSCLVADWSTGSHCQLVNCMILQRANVLNNSINCRSNTDCINILYRCTYYISVIKICDS